MQSESDGEPALGLAAVAEAAVVPIAAVEETAAGCCSCRCPPCHWKGKGIRKEKLHLRVGAG